MNQKALHLIRCFSQTTRSDSTSQAASGTQTSFPGILGEAAKYYANILMPFSPLITKTLQKIDGMGLAIEMIAPSHGAIWRDSGVGEILDAYRRTCRQVARLRDHSRRSHDLESYPVHWRRRWRWPGYISSTSDSGYFVKNVEA